MKKRVEKPRVKRGPAKGAAHSARIPKRHRTETGVSAKPPLEKLLHDTYARKACHLQ
jgi:hypothetical protein